MKTVTLLSIGFMLGFVSCVMVFVGKVIFFPSPREALPFFAGFKEERQEYGLISDFSYKLESEISEKDFQRFVRKMGFPKSSQINEHLYIIDEPQYQKRAEYVGGKLYFDEFEE